MNNKIFYPKYAYYKLNFKPIKEDLKLKYSNVDDYGNIFCINLNKDTTVLIDSIGKVKFLSGVLLDTDTENEINNIETIFQKHIDDFNFLKN